MTDNVSSLIGKSSRDGFGQTIVSLARSDSRIVALSADVSDSVRLTQFKETFPERFFDFGIAEQNLMGIAAGFARSNKIVYVSLYAIFATLRAAEQVRTDICYPNLPVRICASHSGISLGEGGPSHHTLTDVSFFRSLPNMTVIVPADAVEASMALRSTVDLPGPLYMRLSRAKEPTVYKQAFDFQLGKANLLRKGHDLTLIAYGASVGNSLEAADKLQDKGLSCRVVDMASVKPIDRDAVLEAAAVTKMVFTVEEHNIIGGLGSAVAEILAEDGNGTPLVRLGIKDTFTLAGPYPELQKFYRLDADGIADQVLKSINEL